MRARNFIDITGLRFGYLTVIRRTERRARGKKGAALWLCRCDCGTEVEVNGNKLRSGRRKSCAKNGHKWDRWIEQRGLFRKGQHPSEHQSFENMRQRCYNPRHPYYYLYGARGVVVCERWKSFKNFLQDMGTKPTPRHTIDRIDSTGNYEPGNCRWATRAEQSRNRINNVFVEYEGQRLLLVEVVEKLGLSRSVVYGRLQYGWPLARALQTPVQARRKREPKSPRAPGAVARNKSVDLAGQRFGYLTVRRRAGRNKEQRALWLCQCDCGEWIKATPNNLQRGFHKACNVNGHRWNTPEEPTE